MRFVFDWKFYVTLVATIAGVVVPVYLWRADLQARSLQLRVASQTALAPDVPKTVSGLTLSVDGVNLEQPFLTVLELTNDGSRPIPVTEYEDSIQVITNEGVRLVRAQLTDVQPKDLQPKFSIDHEKLQISPLLLNPGDLITFAAITSGGKPDFSVRARIAGIKSVVLEDRSARKSNTAKRVLFSSVAFLLIFVYASCAFALVPRRRFELAKTTLIVGVLACSSGAALLLLPFSHELELSSSQFSLGLGLAAG
ncbi:MAG: hypothetical protein ACREV0_12760, partial [Burkholderiales bacterium]